MGGKAVALCVAACAAIVLGGGSRARGGRVPVDEQVARPADRAAQLLAAMSPTDKFALLTGVDPHAALGVADGPLYVGYIPGNSQLCIPALTFNDGPAGVADLQVGTTAFPSPIAQAATWDESLQQRFGKALGAEAWHKGIDVLLAPDVNIARVPENGRNFEALRRGSATRSADCSGRDQRHPGEPRHRDREALRGQQPGDEPLLRLVERRRPHAARDLPPSVRGCRARRARRRSHVRVRTRQRDLLVREQAAPRTTCCASSSASAASSSPTGARPGRPRVRERRPRHRDAGRRSSSASALSDAVSAGSVSMSTIDTMARSILTSMFAHGVFDDPPPPLASVSSSNVSTTANQKLALRDRRGERRPAQERVETRFR